MDLYLLSLDWIFPHATIGVFPPSPHKTKVHSVSAKGGRVNIRFGIILYIGNRRNTTIVIIISQVTYEKI
jgi:hypothetical protein